MRIYAYLLLANCTGFVFGVLYVSRHARDRLWWHMLAIQIVLNVFLVFLWSVVGVK